MALRNMPEIKTIEAGQYDAVKSGNTAIGHLQSIKNKQRISSFHITGVLSFFLVISTYFGEALHFFSWPPSSTIKRSISEF